MNNTYVYGAAFQHMAANGSVLAARRAISAMLTIMPVRSVIDFGCARGTWPAQWCRQGVEDVVGVDGDYVDRSWLEIDPGRFVVHDLAIPLNLGRRFDLAQSLEVAEHLPPGRAASFVADLVAHAPAVLFSAAPPGQGGQNHINEQPAYYWQRLFLNHGYVAIDCLRPLLASVPGIPAWYRYNLVLYVHRDNLDRVAPFARQFLIPDGEAIGDPSPLPYKIRKRFILLLPRPLRDQLARLNALRYAMAPAPDAPSGDIPKTGRLRAIP